MFNNLITFRDLLKLLRKIEQGEPDEILRKLLSGRQERIKKSWEHTSSPPTNWWDIPAVKGRWNHLISGNAQVDYYEYVYQKYLSGRKHLKALSPGCGTGGGDLRWAEFRVFDRIDAYDLSETRIQHAKDSACQRGYGNIINYRVSNILDVELRPDGYDVVYVDGALHHLSPLKGILVRINRSLKGDGYLFVNEFVGPTRFQWTDGQLEVINALLSILPIKYKTLWGSSSVKPRIRRPSRLSMILKDPSEAVESSRIMPLLHDTLNVVEVRKYGGAVLHMLFSGIAHHFLSEDCETQHLLRLCFRLEDLLMQSGDAQSDFAVVVCRKRTEG